MNLHVNCIAIKLFFHITYELLPLLTIFIVMLKYKISHILILKILWTYSVYLSCLHMMF